MTNFEQHIANNLERLTEQQKIINSFVKKKMRFVSLAVHPDKCTLEGFVFSDSLKNFNFNFSAEEVQKTMNRGRTLVETYLRESVEEWNKKSR